MTLHEALKHYFGFDNFKSYQEDIIRNVMDGKNSFVLMPTGGGKSLCYQLPALLMEGTAIVISPLIALMKNQVDVMRGLGEEGIAHYLNSSLTRNAVEQVKEDVKSGKTKLLYVAPESLTKPENVDFLKRVQISFYAIDEAHCISEWGHDFRPEYRNIRPIIEQIGNAPVIALTATATYKVCIDIKKSLDISDAVEFKSSFNRPNLYYEVRPKTKDIDKEIIRYIKQNIGKSGIIYCLSRRKVEELAAVLMANDIRAAAYHAGFESAVRTQVQDDFISERIDVIVATIAFGMGIDKPDVRFVIHYDVPKSLEGYYQETGRAGRDGGEGKCITFYSYKDLHKLEKFMEGKPPTEQNIGRQLLHETALYAESSVCRRKMLLHYFGEEYNEKNCGNCDNCLHPKSKTEAKDKLMAVLQAIKTLNEKFNIDYIVNFIEGRKTDDILKHKHDELSGFGSSKDGDQRIWNAVILQAILAGYINKSIENYGILKITEAGHKFMKKPSSFMIVEDTGFNQNEDDFMEESGTSALDPALFAMLKNLRRDVAQKHDLPPYVIFQDASLEQMATTYPVTIEELKTISGVGDGKAKKYGQPFCELILKYCEENEIERPDDMRVKTIANKSIPKIEIVGLIDRQIPLENIAESKGFDFPELLEVLEMIVLAGTKLNVDYAINEIFDKDEIEEIFDFLRESETDEMDNLLKEFGNVYPEDGLRLARLKFISDMGN